MTDPLGRELAERVAAATPAALPPFDEVRRRARRHRVRTFATVAASAAVVAGVAVGAWSLRTSDPDSGPDHPVTSPSTSPSSAEPTPSRPDPTYTRSDYPSGLVVRLPERDIDLPADTSCWTEPQQCRRGLLMPGDPVPDLGSRAAIDFWFARPGWDFVAIFRRADQDCPRATTVEVSRTDDQWFRLSPADEAGRYEVELHGQGPEGGVSSRFEWTTTSDGPVDPPEGVIGLFPRSRGEGSYALEVMVNDLAFQPTRSELSRSVEVTVAATDGQQRTLTAPLILASMDCGSDGSSRGSFYYQAEWDDDISVLGRRPFDLEVVMTIRGTTYVGRTTWRGAHGGSGFIPLTFSPPLPAAEVD